MRMTRRIRQGLLTVYVATTFVASSTLVSADSIAPWKKEEFPLPFENPAICHTVSKRFCDPDGILSNEQEVVQRLDEKLSSLSNQVELHCGKETFNSDVQYAVAITKKMDFMNSEDTDQANAEAEVFARYIHDKWGVGFETACGGTGILLFLSIDDRVVYISRGRALDKILTDYRLDQIIDTMKSSLRMRLYGEAILQALDELDHIIRQGEPTIWERTGQWIANYFGLIAILSLMLFICYSTWQDERNRREYALVRSRLDEIDQARAEALQGRFQSVSCPICLESFPQNKKTDSGKRMGSDGKPLRLLRCGHAFDETCWDEWVNTGRVGVDKCPICQQDVGAGCDLSKAPEPELTARLHHDAHEVDRVTHHVQDEVQPLNPVTEQAVLTRHRLERNFRLVRLAMRHPRYVRPDSIQRWTDNNFDGSLARDQSFVDNDPARSAASSHNQSGGLNRVSRNGSFGGGSSGGGRGGSW